MYYDMESFISDIWLILQSQCTQHTIQGQTDIIGSLKLIGFWSLCLQNSKHWCCIFLHSERRQTILWDYTAGLYSLFCLPMSTIEYWDETVLFSIFSKTNKHQRLMRPRHPSTQCLALKSKCHEISQLMTCFNDRQWELTCWFEKHVSRTRKSNVRSRKN